MDDIRELKAAMLAHDSIEKSKRIYDKRNRLHDSDEVAEQYCEFMCLKIKSKDYSAETAKLSPGDKVDAFWHAHLLDTKGYIEFFSTVQADMVHHDAEKSDDPEEEILARQSKTKEIYRSLFSEDCPFFEEDNPTHGKSIKPRENYINRNPRPDREIAVNGKGIDVIVKTLTGQEININIGRKNTAEELLIKLQTERGFKAHNHRFVYSGKAIELARSLGDYDINNNSKIFLIKTMTGC